MVVGVLMCGLLCGTINRPATADPTQETVRSDPRSNATKVALIDMAQVFKKSRLFEQSRNALKLKVDDADVIGKRMTEELQLMIQKSKGLSLPVLVLLRCWKSLPRHFQLSFIAIEIFKLKDIKVMGLIKLIRGSTHNGMASYLIHF